MMTMELTGAGAGGGDEDKENMFRSPDDVNNNCAKFLNRHKSLDLTAHVLGHQQQKAHSLSSSKLLTGEQERNDGDEEAVRVSLALFRPGARTSSVDMLDPIHRAVSSPSTAVFLSNKTSSEEPSQLSSAADSCQPILESSLTRVHKFLREKQVYSADYNPKFKRRTVVLIKSKASSSSGFAKSTSTSNLVANAIPSSSSSQLKAPSGSKHGSFGFNLQSYGVLNPATMQVEYICFVSNVQPDSSAKKAGLENGDVVLSIDNKHIDEFRSLKEILEHVKNKTELKLVIITENVCKKLKYQQRIEQIKETLRQKRAELEALDAQELEIMRKYNLDRNQLLRAKLSVFRSFSDASSSLAINNGGGEAAMYSSFSESSVNSDEKPATAVAPVQTGQSSSNDGQDDHHHTVLEAKRGSLVLAKGERSSSHRTSLNFQSPADLRLRKGSNNVKSSPASGFKLLPNSFSKLNNYKVAATTTAANTSKINHKSQSNLTNTTTTTQSLNHIPALSSGSMSAYYASPPPDVNQSPSEPSGAAVTSSNSSKAKSFAQKFIFSNRIVRSASSSSMNLLSNLKFANGASAGKKSSAAAKKPLFSPLCSSGDDSTAQLHPPASFSDQSHVVKLTNLDSRTTTTDEKIVLDSEIDRLPLEKGEPESPAMPTSSRSTKKMFAPILDMTRRTSVQELVVESQSFDKIAPLADSDSPSSSLEHDSAPSASNSSPVQISDEFGAADQHESFKSVLTSDEAAGNLSSSSTASSSAKYKSLACGDESTSSPSLLYFSPVSCDVSEVYINLASSDSTHNNESTDDSCFLDSGAKVTTAAEDETDHEISNKQALLTTRNSFNYSSSATNKDSLSSSSTSTISTFSNSSSSSSSPSNHQEPPPTDELKPDEFRPLPIRPGALVNKRDQDYIVTRL